MKKLLSLLLASTALLGFGQIRIVPSHPFTNWEPGIRIGIQPRGGGSFGGGGRSFGGGGGGRSFGGGSFGGSGRSFGGSGGSFGGGSMGRSPGGGSFGSGGRSFGGGSPMRSSSPRSSGSSSFGRTGSMGFSGPVRSTSLNNSYRGVSPSSTYHYYYNGSNVTAFGFGMMSGYSLGWLAPRWYYSTPFSPYFYFNQPYYDPVAGAYYPGGFSFGKFLLGIIIIGFIIWLLVRLFGKGKKVKYTTYN